MPTHNRETLIGRSIESVLRQTYRNFEFIIVNDASTDGTELLILDYQRKDGRIVYIKNEENLRIVRSLNKGLRLSRGEYIARIDDDDVWIDPRKLEKQIAFLEHNKDYVIVGTGNVAIFESKNLKMKSLKPETDEEIRHQMLLSCPFLHPAVVYRKSAVENAGLYDENLERCEDYDLWMKFGKIGKMYNLPEYGIESLVGATNISHRKRREILQYNLVLIKKYRSDYPHFFKACFKNYCQYLDASFPFLRKLFWPLYRVRRFFLNRFGKKVKIEKL